MAVNQYLPWDTAGGASVYDPTTYAALASRLAGVVPGVADPIAFNTAMRQACCAAAAIAQFCVDASGTNLNDDGSPATYEAAFIQAFGIVTRSILAAGTSPIRSARATVTIVSNAANIDFSLGNYFVILLNSALSTLTFSNFPPAGIEQEITVDFVADGTAHGVTFLSESLLKWLGNVGAGTAPTFTFTTGYENTVVFKARDGVTSRVVASWSGTAAA